MKSVKGRVHDTILNPSDEALNAGHVYKMKLSILGIIVEIDPIGTLAVNDASSNGGQYDDCWPIGT